METNLPSLRTGGSRGGPSIEEWDELAQAPLPTEWPDYSQITSSSLSPPHSQLEVPIHRAAIDCRGKDPGAEDLTFWNSHDVLRQNDEVRTLPRCNRSQDVLTK